MSKLSAYKVTKIFLMCKTFYRSVKKMTGVFAGGFSLLEIIVVIAIVGILATIAFPAYYSFLEKAKITRAISEIGLLEKEILAWKNDHESLPLNLEEIGRDKLLDPWKNPYQYLNFDTIDEKEKGEDKEKGKDKEDGKDDEKKKQRKDHNLHPINDDFDLFSMGKDGDFRAPLTAKASRDDIIRAKNGSYIGLASKY